MVEIIVRSSSSIIDSGASRHMVWTRDSFTYLDASNGPKIVLGDDSETESKGKSRIYIDHGSFNNFLYVPRNSTNLLSLY